MTEFERHKMADETPQNPDTRYILLGNGGGLYVGYISTLKCADGSTMFKIPNHRSGYIKSKQIKMWAEITLPNEP